MTTKECGSCGLCCKFLDVPGLAPAGKWCQHSQPGRVGGCCAIHDDRPDICRGFMCFWKAESWPDELRPDRCKVLFEALPGVVTILATVEPTRPDAWKRKLIGETIKKLVTKGRPVVVYVKGRPPLFAVPHGVSRADVQADIDRVLKDRKDGGTELHTRS